MGELQLPVFQPKGALGQFPIDVLLADDSEVMRRAIRRLLDSVPGIEVLGETSTFAQMLKMTAKLKPTTVLMDLHMRDEREFKPQFIRAGLLSSAKHVLAMSLWNDEETKTLAERYGATVFLDKSMLASNLIPAIMRFA